MAKQPIVAPPLLTNKQDISVKKISCKQRGKIKDVNIESIKDKKHLTLFVVIFPSKIPTNGD
jgi:hypothetical protein